MDRFYGFGQVFEALTIKPLREDDLCSLPVHPFFDPRSIASVLKVFVAVKELSFSAPFNSTSSVAIPRCSRSHRPFSEEMSISNLDTQEDDGLIMEKRRNDDIMEDVFDSEFRDVGLIVLARNIIRLLSALPENHLTSFG